MSPLRHWNGCHNDRDTTGRHELTLRSIRLRTGLGLRETARQAGIDPGYLSRIELGKSEPSLNILLKLSQSLDADLGQIAHAAHRS